MMNIEKETPKYKPFVIQNFRTIPQIQKHFSEEEIFEMEKW